jgi:hypothetical protein
VPQTRLFLKNNPRGEAALQFPSPLQRAKHASPRRKPGERIAPHPNSPRQRA